MRPCLPLRCWSPTHCWLRRCEATLWSRTLWRRQVSMKTMTLKCPYLDQLDPFRTIYLWQELSQEQPYVQAGQHLHLFPPLAEWGEKSGRRLSQNRISMPNVKSNKCGEIAAAVCAEALTYMSYGGGRGRVKKSPNTVEFVLWTKWSLHLLKSWGPKQWTNRVSNRHWYPSTDLAHLNSFMTMSCIFRLKCLVQRYLEQWQWPNFFHFTNGSSYKNDRTTEVRKLNSRHFVFFRIISPKQISKPISLYHPSELWLLQLPVSPPFLSRVNSSS